MRTHPVKNFNRPAVFCGSGALRVQALLWCLAAAVAVAPLSRAASGFTEPPAVLYGKIIHMDEGATFQVFTGTLRITLANETSPANRVAVETSLAPKGPNGEFSYRVEIPQKHLPSQDELPRMLAVSSATSRYQFSALTVDGISATPLDSAQSLLATSFSTRGSEHRLDLKVTLPQSDTDNDGIPDWWENLHGLNPMFAGDAADDTDADGWDAATEFLRGTNPAESNVEPLVSTTSILVPVGGWAGFHLTVHDSDSEPAELQLATGEIPAGISLFKGDAALTSGSLFTYAEVLAGGVSIQAAGDFSQAMLPLTIQNTNGTGSPAEFEILLKGFSPATSSSLRPAAWLTASDLAATLAPGAQVSEWPDLSGTDRDGYQGISAEMPRLGSSGLNQVEFDGSQFLYIDDRGLNLPAYTALIAFQILEFSQENQTLFRSPELSVSIGGDADPTAARTLRIQERGRSIHGPAIAEDTTIQVTLARGSNGSFATILGQTVYPSFASTVPLEDTFTTLGALQGKTAATAREHLVGALTEVLIYDQLLDPGARSRHEDYQLSRWTSVVVWDHRDQTDPAAITGIPDRRNSINGGWGNDQLTGGSMADTLRGGPGNDLLAGGDGADRFQFFAEKGHDIITDFDESEGDILDLTPIFAEKRGSPGDYISLRLEVTRGSDDVPVVNTVLEMDYSGLGDGIDQRVTLQNVRLTQADLLRLAGEGVIQLGGPQYPTALSIAAQATTITETEIPRTISLARTGNLDAHLTFDLSFAGSAELDADYTVDDTGGSSGLVRTVSFERGQSTLLLNLTPIQDIFAESEEIRIGVLAHPQITDPPGSALAIRIEDAPLISIRSIQPYAQRLGEVPGLIELSRSGPISEPLAIELQFSGSAVNGVDYQLIAPAAVFPAGVRTLHLEVKPALFAPLDHRAALAQVSVQPDLNNYALATPWTASVLILDAYGGELRSFGSWSEAFFPGDSSAALATADPDEDFVNNIVEYVAGTDPTEADEITENRIEVYRFGQYLEIHVVTAAGLSDVQLALQTSVDLATWTTQDDIFEQDLQWRQDGRVLRVYRSKVPVTSLNTTSFYRLGVSQLAVPSIEGDAGVILGAAHPFLARSGPVWPPSEDGTQLDSPPLQAGQSSEFSTFVAGPCEISFQWRATLDLADSLEFLVDGVVIGQTSGAADWTSVSASISGDGLHQLVWRLRRAGATSAPGASASMRNLSLQLP